MACFTDINVSQGSVATYARCGEICNIQLTTNLTGNLPVIFLYRLTFDRIIVMSQWHRPHFFDPPCTFTSDYSSVSNSVHCGGVLRHVFCLMTPRESTRAFIRATLC